MALLRESPIALRDRALLLLGFAGAFRRSELVGLDIEDLEFSPRGIRVVLRRSNTDQEAKGRPVGIPYGAMLETCPVGAVERWLAHGRGVLPAERARAAVPLRFAGQSLRAGLATSAAAGGVSEGAMNQTGHRSLTIVRRYIRDGELFRDDNAARGAGL